MAELIIRPEGGRAVTIEISEAEARRILNDLVFRLDQPPVPSVDEKKIKSTTPLIEETNKDASGSDFLPIPSREEIAAFIKSQSDYTHSVESIAQHFAQRKVSTTEGRPAELWQNSIRSAGNRIREEIETQENGKWISERRARQKVFRFIKQEGNDDQRDLIFDGTENKEQMPE